MASVSYLVHCDTLLQNAADIIRKCDSYVITKCDKSLLQNFSGFLLQNPTILLQEATILFQNATFITKCVGTGVNESIQSETLLLNNTGR